MFCPFFGQNTRVFCSFFGQNTRVFQKSVQANIGLSDNFNWKCIRQTEQVGRTDFVFVNSKNNNNFTIQYKSISIKK